MGESVKVGSKVKDTITGFIGVVTARVEYFGGKVDFRVEAPVADGKLNSEWFPEQRLTVVEA